MLGVVFINHLSDKGLTFSIKYSIAENSDNLISKIQKILKKTFHQRIYTCGE